MAFSRHDAADLRVERLEVQAPNNKIYVTHAVSTAEGTTGAVCVVVCNEHILLGKHYRAALDKQLWEFPRGMGNEGETPLETAKRELKEETGLSIDDARELGTIYADSGLLSNPIAVVLLTSNSVDTSNMTSPEPISDELDELRWVTPDELDSAIRAGKISCGITLAAYSIWKAKA